MGWAIPAGYRTQILKSAAVYQKQIEKPSKQKKKGKAARALTLASSAAAASKQAATPVNDAMPVLESAARQPVSIVDGNALVRSKVVSGVSALTIAQATMRTALQNNPSSLIVSFDTFSNHSLMRAEVQKKRQQRTAMHITEKTRFLKNLACSTAEDLWRINVSHLPLLRNANVDWQVAFAFSDTKKWAVTVFETALRHIAVEAVALKKRQAPNVTIFCSDGTTQHTVTSIGVYSKVQSNYRPQEGDLDSFSHAMQQDTHVMLHTIDTDLVLLPFANALAKPTHDVWICLKNEAYDFSKLVGQMTDGSIVGRLNVAFWMMALGTDYNASLTTVGYYTKDLLGIVQSKPNKPFSVSGTDGYLFTIKDAMAMLPTKVCKPKNITKDIHNLLKQIAYSVQYYGRWWDPETHPCGPDLPTCSGKDPNYALRLSTHVP